MTTDRLVTAAILGGQLPQEPDFRSFPNGFIFRGLWGIGRDCWHDDPQKRPSALDVLNELANFVDYLQNNAFSLSTFLRELNGSFPSAFPSYLNSSDDPSESVEDLITETMEKVSKAESGSSPIRSRTRFNASSSLSLLETPGPGTRDEGEDISEWGD